MTYKDTSLWRKAFDPKHDGLDEHRTRLLTSFDAVRAKAEILAGEIPRSAPDLTDHSIKHLDALWELASLIAGTEVVLNPTEAYTFGVSILLHDLGNALAAYPNGLQDLRGPSWDDLVHIVYVSRVGRPPSKSEKLAPKPELLREILLYRLRDVHAEQAERLALDGFFSLAAPHSRTFLIDDEALRLSLGSLIGRIAHSHYWDIQRVEEAFSGPLGTPTCLPSTWPIDALKLACLLRCADIAHLDQRRAPTFLRHLRKPSKASLVFWDFQSLLLRPQVKTNDLVYTGSRPFAVDEREAWWKAFDALVSVDTELRDADAVLRARREYQFAARRVAGIASPKQMMHFVQASGWEPLDVRVKITDVAGVVQKFGGHTLYGSDLRIPLRELIANAADAVRARRLIENRDKDWGRIDVRIRVEGKNEWLEVEDNGIGMSEDVLRGPLLDFGTSYWDSSLASHEHPGLVSGGFTPTGRFGIGFFSVFELGTVVQVVSRPFGLVHRRRDPFKHPPVRLDDCLGRFGPGKGGWVRVPGPQIGA